ncbi:hypothetical protein JTB14_006135 [Gonioctena quinquepunctata]|nr:hypothetical protein JTB14_006135 [Gonioctena quinquepunctata]
MENTNGDITEKEKRKLNKTVLDNFSSLTNPQEAVRLKSSVNLLKHLAGNDKNDELKYALGRIIRGLGSSTSCARTGFYTALVALFNVKNEITIDEIFEHIQKHLHKASGNTKSENADIFSGRILACGAIIRSNLWSKYSNGDKFKVLEFILQSSKERFYLGLLAYQFIIMALEKINDNDFEMIWPLLRDEVSKPWSEQHLDSLYLLCYIKNKYPNVINRSFLKKTIGTDELICPQSLDKLCRVLMTIPKLTSKQHFVYELISEEIAASDLLSDFVQELDKYLDFPNRNKLLVASFFTLILQKLKNTSVIPDLLTKNFVQQTLNFFKTLKGKNQDPEFMQIVQTFFDQLLLTLKSDEIKSKTKIAVLKKLLLSPGTFIFEKITRSKVIQLITLNLNKGGVKKLSGIYRGVISGTEIIDSQYGHSENWLNNDKLYAAHLLIKLLNHSAMKEENEWKVDQLVFLMDLSFFRSDDGTHVTHIGNELAASLKVAFFGALDLKLTKMEDLQNILMQLMQHLDSKITAENLETVLRTPITEEHYTVWQKTTQIAAKISGKLEKENKRVGIKSVFLTLFLHMGLQLFNDAKLSSDSLSELFICYKKAKKNKNESKNFNNSDVEGKMEDKLQWIEVVIDLILNLLSHNSHLLRSIIKSVFPHLCQYMTPATIQQMLSILDPKNEDNPLSKIDEQDSDEEDEDAEHENEEEENEEEDSEEDDDVDDEENEDETVNDKLRIALHKALISNGYKSDEESIDMDEMSETEGENLDKALADAFRKFKPNHGKRKKQTKDQETLTHFRIRVLDLVEIYLESTPSMILSLEIMLPLLQAVEFCIRDEHQGPLLTRLKSCLKKLTNLKKFSDTEGVDGTVLHDLLKSLLEKGTKTAWIVQDMGVQIADCCIFVIRCSNLLITSEMTPKKTKKRLKSSIAEVVSSELETYMHQRDCFTPLLLFKNILRQSWDGSLDLVMLLLRYIFDEDIKAFKKNQVFELLKLFYTNQRYLSSNTEKIREILSEDHASFCKNVLNLFKSLTESPEAQKVKEKFISNVFDVLSVMKTTCLNIDNIRWQEISEIIREYRSTVTFSKDTKISFSKLCNRLGVSNVVKMKPKPVSLHTDKSDEDDDKTSERNVREKRKKSKNKEKLRLKKEAKELRLNSLSQGFGKVDFRTDIDMREADINGDERDTDVKSSDGEAETQNGVSLENVSKKKKRKLRDSEIDGENQVKSKKKNKLFKDNPQKNIKIKS